MGWVERIELSLRVPQTLVLTTTLYSPLVAMVGFEPTINTVWRCCISRYATLPLVPTAGNAPASQDFQSCTNLSQLSWRNTPARLYAVFTASATSYTDWLERFNLAVCTGIEPVLQAWQARVLTTIRTDQKGGITWASYPVIYSSPASYEAQLLLCSICISCRDTNW